MALFSFRHSVKTFSPKCGTKSRMAAIGQTEAHLHYITRSTAARDIVRKRIDQPTDTLQGRAAESEAQKRRGRVCERFIIALPVEASVEQRVELATEFADALTQGKTGYILAIHDKAGNGQQNPHFHLVAFDKHEKSGARGRPKSVLGMSRKHAVEMWAERWASLHNRKMSEWGFGTASAISHLSFDKRGIDRIPEIHEGPGSRAMSSRGAKAAAKPEWKHIDAGKSRAEANSVIREINQLNEENRYATGNRLGSPDRRNPAESDSRRSALREDCQWGSSNPFPGWNPSTTACENRQRATGDHKPPWIVGAETNRGVGSREGSAHERGKHASSGPFEMAKWRRARRTPVRRVFLELIFLRDTLRARLAIFNGRRHARPLSKSIVASPTRAITKNVARERGIERST